MAGKSPKTSLSSKAMDAALEAKSLISTIGQGFPVGTPIKTVIARVSRDVGLGERRVRAFWNGEVSRPHSDGIDALRAAAAKRQHRTATDELRELRQRVAHLERIIAAAEGAHRDRDLAGE